MKKFFKLVNTEIKKILLKPNIFILAAFLILALTVSGFTYKPTEKDSTYTNISGDSVSEIVTEFNSDYGNNTKSAYDEKLNNLDGSINVYVDRISKPYSDSKAEFLSKLNTLNISFNTLYTLANSENTEIYTIKNNSTQLSTNFENFYTDFNSKLKESATSYMIKSSSYYSIDDNYLAIKNELSNINTSTTKLQIQTILQTIKSKTYIQNINTLIKNDSINISLSAQVRAGINDTYDEALLRLTSINAIIQNYEDSQTTPEKIQINKLILNYFETATQAVNVIKYSYQLNMTNSELLNFYGYENFNSYLSKEKLTTESYLFENNLFSNEVANSFNISSTSNKNTNAYDFMYSTMQIISFILIIFAIIMVATLVAEEYQNGSIKMLLIRPYSRNKIFFAKLSAVVTLSKFFIFLGTAVSLIIGGILYGFSSLPVLCVFNASIAFTIHPLLLTVLFMVSLFVKLYIYIILSALIATTFKNSIATIVIGMTIYFSGLVSNIFVSNYAWSKFLPFQHLDLFNYLSFHSTSSSTLINSFFIGNYSLNNFYISLFAVTTIAIILTIPAFNRFKHNDI